MHVPVCIEAVIQQPLTLYDYYRRGNVMVSAGGTADMVHLLLTVNQKRNASYGPSYFAPF